MLLWRVGVILLFVPQCSISLFLSQGGNSLVPSGLWSDWVACNGIFHHPHSHLLPVPQCLYSNTLLFSPSQTLLSLGFFVTCICYCNFLSSFHTLCIYRAFHQVLWHNPDSQQEISGKNTTFVCILFVFLCARKHSAWLIIKCIFLESHKRRAWRRVCTVCDGPSIIMTDTACMVPHSEPLQTKVCNSFLSFFFALNSLFRTTMGSNNQLMVIWSHRISQNVHIGP